MAANEANDDLGAIIASELDQIEVEEDITIDEVRENDGTLVANVIDDLVVIAAPDGSVVDETIDIVDLEGHLVVEEEIVTVYDADANVVSRDETISIPLENLAP
jgi:hypothetical protein